MDENVQPASPQEELPVEVTSDLLETWATDSQGPVALHLRQTLLPVETIHEDEKRIIYPPTYADIGYNIDTLSDGTRVALIDSVGSQANRLEPIFKEKYQHDDFDDWLVPQIEILLHPDGSSTKGKQDTEESRESPEVESRSLLDLAHRSADAVVHASPTLAVEVEKAFGTLKRTGDAGPLCTLAPTSLLFGVWDSRGGSNEKRPRLVRSVIRAWNVDVLHAAAQFNSVWKALDEKQQDELQKEAEAKKTKLSEKGLADAPATFRKVSTKAASMTEFRGGSPNPERRVLGGVLVHGPIEREVTVNLVALRSLRGKNGDETQKIQKYLLGLSLMAAMADIELFLREGCNLRFADEDKWYEVPRRDRPRKVALATEEARSLVLKLAIAGRQHFKSQWPKAGKDDLALQHHFSLAGAKKLLAKKAEDAVQEEI